MHQDRARWEAAMVDRAILSGDLPVLLRHVLERFGAPFGGVYAYREEGLFRQAVSGPEAASLPPSLAPEFLSPPWPCDRGWSLMHRGRPVGHLVLGGGAVRVPARVRPEVELTRLAACLERLNLKERRQRFEVLRARAREMSESQVRSHAVVSHQLKTPLQLGQSLISDALAHVQDHERVGRRLDTLFESLRRFHRSMVALFDRHGIHLERHRPQPVPVNLLSMGEQLVKELEPALRRRRLTCSLEIGPDLWAIADPLRLEIVLENLLGNAIKAAPRETGIALSADATDGQVRFRVANPGGPIPPGRLGQLFRPQSPNPEDPTSTGLGLSLSRDYLHQMGGGISLIAHEQGEVVFEGWLGRA